MFSCALYGSTCSVYCKDLLHAWLMTYAVKITYMTHMMDYDYMLVYMYMADLVM